MSKQTQNKTVANTADVSTFLDKVTPEEKRNDARLLLDIMMEISHEQPMMWGSSIVGFGEYHYKYESGREGNMCRIGFSPRKTALTIYCITGFAEKSPLLEKLGKYKLGKSCLYIKKLADVDVSALKQIITDDWNAMNKKYSK